MSKMMDRMTRQRSQQQAQSRVARILDRMRPERPRAPAPEPGRSEIRVDAVVDPRLLAQLEDLDLIARTAVEGFLHGLHRSPYVGFSVEFASHREYLFGDDLRHLNWKLYGRNDKLYVKQYDAETNLDCHLVIDVSASMETASAGLSKRRYATMLAATVAHLALRQRDAVGAVLFADRVLTQVKPRARTAQLSEILTALVSCPGRAAASTPGVLHEVAELMPRRGLVVLISDLFYAPDQVFSGLDHLGFHGHDLLVFQVLDPIEHHMPLEGQIRFHDLESGAELITHVDEVRSAYTAAVAAWFAELEEGTRSRGIDRVALTTDVPLDQALFDYLTKRAAMY
jgi:uncharacterized protein (DUF58 family)